MKDLLKEAIADAKAVRQTALANAKLALEEAFTPRLQSMLSAKLAEEMEEEEPVAEAEEGEEVEMAEEAHEGGEEHSEEEVTAEGEESEEMPEEPAEEEMAEEGEMENDDDLDLDEILRELEGEEEVEATEEPVEETLDSSDIKNDDDLYEGEEDEDIDVNEIIKSLREEDETAEEEMKEEESKEEELEEAYNVIRFLKDKINEVNLLNAKLLYSNKLFRNFSLNEGQKMKVIENFDRAHNLREVKLVYSTLAEGFKVPTVTKKVVKESFASKPVASTKPAKQVISEGTELANRFKKLAGLK